MDTNTSNRYLVNNPIYKTNDSSLVGSTNSVLSNGNRKFDKTSAIESHLLAHNPQYGPIIPLSNQSQRSSSVVSEKEPAYELLPESQNNTQPNSFVQTAAEGDPIYSEPVPTAVSKVLEAHKVQVVPKLPEYTAVRVAMGKDDAYAKLNHSK